jgi:hypothetical protein
MLHQHLLILNLVLEEFANKMALEQADYPG